MTIIKKTALLALTLLLTGLLPAAVFARIPNDPHAKQWAYEDIGLYDAWEQSTGSDHVVVAVIDNGFDMLHPDLRDNVWVNEGEVRDNGIDDDGNGYIDDYYGWNFTPTDVNGDGEIGEDEARGNNDPRPDVNGVSEDESDKGIFNHGTLVAGLIGAVGENEKDGVGVNWRVRLMNIKVVGNSGVGNFEPLAEAVRYAVDNGADVINMSMVGRVDNGVSDAIAYAYEHGVAVVAAIGNDRMDVNDSPVYPACADAGSDVQMVLGVSAIQPSHYLAQFSNVGSDCVDITAPGQDVSSTVRFSPTNGLDERYSGGWHGTSFATPLVSGALALVKQIQPHWGPDELYTALLGHTHRTPGQDPAVYANLFGAGLLQVDKAVAYAYEQRATQRIRERVTLISTDGGVLSAYDFADAAWTHTSGTPFTRDLDDVVALPVPYDGIAYVGVRARTKNTSRVYLYDAEWQLKKSWVTQSSGPLRLEVMDIEGAAAPDVLLAPAYADDQLLRVFTLFGDEVGEHSMNGVHDGVALAGTYDGQIFLAYERDDDIYVTTLDQDLDVVREVTLDGLPSVGGLALGDVDADGVDELVLHSASDDPVVIGYYEQDGTRIHQFLPYGLQSVAAVRVLLGDIPAYDSPGHELVLLPESGAAAMSVWGSERTRLDWIEGVGATVRAVR